MELPPPAGPRVFGAFMAGVALLAAAAASLEAPRSGVALWLTAIPCFGLGLAVVLVRERGQAGPLGIVALGSALGGLFAGATLAALTAARGWPNGAGIALGLLFGLPIACAVFAPLCTLPFAPLLVAATRAMRAPSHDGPAVVLTVAGAWAAVVSLALAVFGGYGYAYVPAFLGLTLVVAGEHARDRLVEELAAIRSGARRGLSLVGGAEAEALADASLALPLLRGADVDAQAWVVRSEPTREYRDAPARVTLARVQADARSKPNVVRAAFAGARPMAGAAIVLALWGAALVLIAEFALFRAHR